MCFSVRKSILLWVQFSTVVGEEHQQRRNTHPVSGCKLCSKKPHREHAPRRWCNDSSDESAGRIPATVPAVGKPTPNGGCFIKDG
jgi:hypothetical protein